MNLHPVVYVKISDPSLQGAVDNDGSTNDLAFN